VVQLALLAAFRLRTVWTLCACATLTKMAMVRFARLYPTPWPPSACRGKGRGPLSFAVFWVDW
jgi:hypothetical protein